MVFGIKKKADPNLAQVRQSEPLVDYGELEPEEVAKLQPTRGRKVEPVILEEKEEEVMDVSETLYQYELILRDIKILKKEEDRLEAEFSKQEFILEQKKNILYSMLKGKVSGRDIESIQKKVGD